MDGEAPESDLLRELASALSDSDPQSARVELFDLRERALLLRVARDVAHATERQNAPLASYLIGRFVQTAVTAGASESDALERAAALVRSLLGEVPV
jgi:hypothetical protein